MSFLDAGFDEYIVGGVDVSNNRAIQNTPEEMMFVALNYTVPAFSGDVLLTTNYSYKGDIQQFEIASEDIDQEAYGIWNASVVWTSAADTWLVGLHGKNLADEEYATAGYCFGFESCPSALGGENNTTVFFGPPRTVLATVEYRFQ